MADKEVHYVTTIEIKKVVNDPGIGMGDDRRSTTTVARIVLSSKDLESARDKASAHLALVEDGGDIDGRKVLR